ncbi:unnamed protein product, partial [Adineta steineri]
MYYKSPPIIFFIWVILITQCISFPHLASKRGLDCNQPSDHPFIPPGPNDIRLAQLHGILSGTPIHSPQSVFCAPKNGEITFIV